jgi:hypothetical protein
MDNAMSSADPASPLLDSLERAVIRILRALMRVLLEHGMAFDRFAELAKMAYVDAAKRHFVIAGRKQTASRLSILTGLTRKEVARLTQEGSNERQLAAHNRATRVVSGWRRELASRRLPLSTPIEIYEAEPFALSLTGLVRQFSGDMPVRAVLDELLRTEAISRDGDRVSLNDSSYVPQDQVQKLLMLGTDTADLINAIGHNLREPQPRAFFQRKVAYDNLPVEVMDALMDHVRRIGVSTIDRLDQDLALYDRDTNPSVQGTGRKRAMVGIYFYQEDMAEPGEPVAPTLAAGNLSHD